MKSQKTQPATAKTRKPGVSTTPQKVSDFLPASAHTVLQAISGAAKTPEYSPAAVKALMKRLDMNERAFALLMNVSPRTVRMWITGAARPCGISRRLMQIYEAGPEIVGRLIAGAEDGQ